MPAHSLTTLTLKEIATSLEYLSCMCLGECGLGKVDLREKTGALSGTEFELELQIAAAANMNTVLEGTPP